MHPRFQDLIRHGVGMGASDLHMCVEQPPVFRIDGRLQRQGQEVLTYRELADICLKVVPEERRADFESRGEVDFSVGIPGVSRVRINVYRTRGSLQLAARILPFNVRPLSGLPFADVAIQMSRKPHGLFLVTGPTGSGKSTTLAGMVEQINSERECHIVTLEDPIEFVFKHKKSIINQREVGSDTLTFANGLRSALRQDPDVILVGEMRDVESIALAITAAETGHLVLASLHSNDAAQTVDRMVDVFPANQQNQIRFQLSQVLVGIVSQQLLARVDQPGRIVAAEVLVATPAVRNLIREGKAHQIPMIIQTSAKLGMKTMEQSVRELYEKGFISQEDYVKFAPRDAEATGASTGPGGGTGAGRPPVRSPWQSP